MSHEEMIKNFLEELEAKSETTHAYFGKHTVMVPSRLEVVKLIKRIQHLMFPEYFAVTDDVGCTREEIADKVFIGLKRQLTASYSFFDEESVVDTEEVA